MTVRRSVPWWLLPLVAGLVAVAVGWLRWVDPATWHFADLEVFRTGGGTVLDGAELYGAKSGTLAFTYPPFAALVFVPLTVLDAVPAQWVMTAASLAAYAVVAWISVSRAGATSKRALGAWTTVVFVLGAALEPVQRTFVFGQVNLVLAALVLVDLFVLPRRFKGALIGLVAGIKLTPAFFAVYFLLRRDWASLARCIASGAATVAVGWVVMPRESLRYWLHDVASMAKFDDYQVLPTNQSVRACLVRMLGGDDPGGVYLVIAVALAGLAAAACHRQLRAGEGLAAAACLGVGALLVSPISWTHHWVWVVPVLCVMARRGWRVAVVLVVAAMFLPPMWAASSDPLHLSPWLQALASSYVILGVAWLVVMVLRVPRSTAQLLARPRSRTASRTEGEHVRTG